MNILDYSGIYWIRNIVNGKFYIGSTICFNDRKASHKAALRTNTSYSTLLQRAWNKYGEKAFVFEPLFVCSPENLRKYEQMFLDYYQPFGDNGYNVLVSSEYGAANRGVPKSPEHKAKIAAAHKRVMKSKEHREALRKPKSAQHRAALSRAKRGMPSPQKGIPLSAYQKDSLLRANLGSKHSEEQKAKISASLKAAYASGKRLKLKPGMRRSDVEVV